MADDIHCVLMQFGTKKILRCMLRCKASDTLFKIYFSKYVIRVLFIHVKFVLILWIHFEENLDQ